MPCSSPMRIGIFGATGPAGSALALRLASVGFEVLVGSRSQERCDRVVADLTGRWPDRRLPIVAVVNELAAEADLVVIATPWDSAAITAHAHSQALDGKVVVSMANALVRVGNEFEPLIPPRGSVAAHVQAAVPVGRGVAAFHHLPAKELSQLDHPVESDVLVCGDDRAAVQATMDVAAKIPGCRPLDAGELSNATAIEAFTAVLLQLNLRYKTRVAPRLTGIRT
jgi:8-hydroxy-5-deazaflavin:NADPH oxidoreductase